MSDLPNLTPAQVAELIPNACNIERVNDGGQKVVFKGIIGGTQYALKFGKVPVLPEDMEGEEFSMSDVAVRAKREVETMRDCNSPYMVKLGPIGLQFATVNNQAVLYFSEEFICGHNLNDILQHDGRILSTEVVKLGLHATDAIKALWKLGKVHRDIKPGNIMRRDSDGEYVLLDAGLAFDVVGESLSIGPVGTPPYFSPEQFDFSNRRTVMDFRSDLFSLGVTMYEMATSQHPFWTRGETSRSLFNKITTLNPKPPKEVVLDFPEKLNDIIMRMLGKAPHLRYRRCQQLIDALNEI
ncbi:MAG: serine/threonine protein kinase [Pirellulales bacterium]|nr:serine/threonine protein kinase [Pirellulales bacterium]